MLDKWTFLQSDMAVIKHNFAFIDSLIFYRKKKQKKNKKKTHKFFYILPSFKKLDI